MELQYQTKFTFSYSKCLQFLFLNKHKLPTENPDQLFSIKLFGNAACPAQPTFYFNQTQLTQSKTAHNFKNLKPTLYFFNYNVLESQKTQLEFTFIFSNPANSAKSSS